MVLSDIAESILEERECTKCKESKPISFFRKASRGLLCVICNMLLGHIENDKNRFKDLLKYLEEDGRNG